MAGAPPFSAPFKEDLFMADEKAAPKKRRNSLTEEEEKDLINFRAEWFKIGSCTDPCDRKLTEKTILELYAETGSKKKPQIIWGNSPYALTQEYPWLKKHSPLVSASNIYWVAFYLFGSRLGDFYTEENLRKLKLAERVVRNCFLMWRFENACFVSERPSAIRWSDPPERAVLHAIERPAVEFRDGKALWAVRGIRVTEKIACGKFTHNDILKERNAEIRRVMMEVFGEGKFLEAVGAKPIHEDKYGTLFSATLPGETQPMMAVRVIDATPQPDGVRKIYWLSVDPRAYGGLKTAHAAVASTWRNRDGSLYFGKPEDYHPDIET